MTTFNVKRLRLDSTADSTVTSTRASAAAAASSSPDATVRKTVRVSPEVHQELLDRATSSGLSIDQILQDLLKKSSNTTTSSFIPRGSKAFVPGIGLMQMNRLKNLYPFLRCPQHLSPLAVKLSLRGQSPYLFMRCPQECVHVFWGTDTFNPPTGKKRYARSVVANQLALACSVLNNSHGEYSRLCNALTLPPLSRTFYHGFRSLTYKSVIPIWEGQEPLYQTLAQAADDRHLQMDGTYSQRRNADHCTVTLMTSEHHLVVVSAVGSKKELNTTSQGLEPELSARAVLALAASPLKPKSIVHDEHTAVTKLMTDLRRHLPPDFEERHDGWHRKRNVAKYLPDHLSSVSGVTKYQIEDVTNKVLIYLNSAFYKFKGLCSFCFLFFFTDKNKHLHQFFLPLTPQ